MQFVQDGGLPRGIQTQHHNLECKPELHQQHDQTVCDLIPGTVQRRSGPRVVSLLARISRVPHILSNSFFRELPMAEAVCAGCLGQGWCH